MKNEELGWLSDRLKPIVKISKLFRDDGLVVNNEHNWSVMKLLILGGWSYVYTTIIPNYFEKFFYVDLLAGTGAIKVQETGDMIIGSPLIAYFYSRNDFTKMFLVELDKDKLSALKKRMATVERIVTSPPLNMSFPNISYYEGDCNVKVDEVISHVTLHGKKVHFLGFIDNEGFDTHWETVKKLLKVPCDLVILFPTSSCDRIKASCEKALNRFFGCESWRNMMNRDEFLMLYEERLGREYQRTRYKDSYVSHIRVGTKQFYYDLVLVCKDGPYVRAWEYLRSKLDWQNPETISIVLDMVTGRILPLDVLAGLHDELQKIDRKNQPRLDDFI